MLDLNPAAFGLPTRTVRARCPRRACVAPAVAVCGTLEDSSH